MSASPLRRVQLVQDEEPPPSLLDAFHRINNVLPDDLVVKYVESDWTVREALTLLRDNNFSQAPVRAGEFVLGIFSYRSFGQGAVDLCSESVDIGELPVDEFVEPISYAGLNDELLMTFDDLDRDNAILVGSQEKLVGILTPVDVLRYLYDAASPFVFIAEIEQTLRRIISACCTDEELATCIDNALTRGYDGNPPAALQEMTFNDYVQLIGDGRNWKHFASAFGSENDYLRKRTRRTLEEIRDLRNEIFHFKREITKADRLKLAEHRTWLWMKALRVHARQQGSNG